MLLISPLVALSLSFLQLVPPAQANTSAICSTITQSRSLSSRSGTFTSFTLPPISPPLPTTVICGDPGHNVTSRPISTTTPHTTRPVSTTRTTVRQNTTTPISTIRSTTVPVTTTPTLTVTSTTPLITFTPITPSVTPITPPGSDNSGGGSNNTDPAPNPPSSASSLSAGMTSALLGAISVGMLLVHTL